MSVCPKSFWIDAASDDYSGSRFPCQRERDHEGACRHDGVSAFGVRFSLEWEDPRP